MMRNLPLLICCLFLATIACRKSQAKPEEATPAADSSPGMTRHVFTSTSIGNFGYWLYTPENATDNMPLIVYLHGGSGRGSDLNLVVNGSLPLFLKDGLINIPGYIVIPQCPANKTWEMIGSSVIELLNKITVDKKINGKRISLTGHSLGGSGTWSLGATYSSLFSCIAPLSGSVSINKSGNYKGFPVWAFVGSADTIVDPASSEAIVPQINSLGGNAQIKIYADATHFDVPALVYKDQSVKLLDWMIKQTKINP